MKDFQGTGVAMVTPFTTDYKVDFDGLRKLTEFLIAGGVEYLVVMGTTGESATLSDEEKQAILNTVVAVADGRVKIVYGIGGNDTQKVVNTIEKTDFTHIDAILSVSPYYNKPTQEGIYQHYKSIAAVAPKPIILYNVPGRTGSNMAAETTLRLAKDFSNIIAVKEASGNMEQVMKIIHERPEGFLVISGDDNLTFPMLALGGDGVISVSGQGFPELFSTMVREGLAGDFAAARIKHYRLFEITKMLFQEGNPGGIKAVLAHQNICGATMRQPLWPISASLDTAIKNEVDAILK
ncbi:MAG: 4-hydroxy-tetrahydrodipicolinate synthase [Schleiferiaceae bacterium]|nr:4-hydroxy-tetrahydrodipicolinate synthase [Schleiferiaceae bacterium]